MAAAEVWAVCRLLPDLGPLGWECNGVYTTLEAALAACKDDKTAAVRFVLNEDMSAIKEWWHATPSRPEPYLVTERAA
jgi:hypothetical protein